MKQLLLFITIFFLIACDNTDPQDTIRVNKDEYLQKMATCDWENRQFVAGQCPKPSEVECLGLYSTIVPKNKLVCSGEYEMSLKLQTCLSTLNLCQTGSGYIINAN